MFGWILSILESGGYAGIFFLMILENIFPPIPSEIIIPLAGFAAAEGDLNLVMVILVATTGSVVGCLPWYFAGRYFGIERLKRWSLKYGRLLTLSPENIDTAQAWFKRYGYLSVFAGRLIPAIRTLISLPAGIVRMPLIPFLMFSFFGSALWTTALVLVGYGLESQYEKAAGYVDIVSNAIIAAIIGYYLYRVVTFDGKK
jgi:membrane protein DedA with SNARE-associated domain